MDGLEVLNIRKVYGTKAVVDGVSFKAAPGRILGVLGPNGAGKTTILRMIMGITAPDEGKITFIHEGRQTQGIPFSTIGYLPEERGLYKQSKVITILVFLASLKNVPKDRAQERSLSWLRKFQLEGYAHAKVEELSKGMAQKVQFVASVLHEPKFVVLDEPFSGLDPVSQDQFKDEIRALAAKGATVLLCSHQMNIVEELCDEIFLIDQGHKVVAGELQAVKERYGNFRINLLTPEPPEKMGASHLLESVEQNGDGRYFLILKDGVTPTEFVHSLPAGLEIHELNITRPSLHDIFVKIARGGQ